MPPRPTATRTYRRGLRRQEPAAVGYDTKCTFLENFDSTIYFSKTMTIKYKKIQTNPISCHDPIGSGSGAENAVVWSEATMVCLTLFGI
jgi:hypothetical protein